MGKAKGVKYSSYLDNIGQLRLEKFCAEFDCSKAKAISYLLELWENGTINNKLATISDDIYAQLENKLEGFITNKINDRLHQVHEDISELKGKIGNVQEKITHKR